ncbi:A/G-specific adenine glycosylase [Sulfurospirillum arcachonense]|uniref:A/G-specific adenine glycosylase n=1 Tax=Sulfurospirillum arcachonense TaxID=57666 RepID=UPI00046AA83F|nr:A/G-specific adenine glycosylase [Sulfurospirillum arcachonense]
MLQQTQVSRVQEHFYPLFLKKYPTLKALAGAKIDDVLASWSGLGYYSRARNLHKSAILCKEDGLPKSMKELQTLFGVGRYTASAICSFGYHQKVPVVDTNISRVLKRYFALLDEKLIWQMAEKFLNPNEPTKHNLALMDLGSLICTPTNPQCKECPLSFTCKGKNEPELYTKKKKTQYENLELFLGVCIQNNKIALSKSQTKLYKGLLVLPETEPLEENFIASFKHSYTKYRITVNLYKTKTYDENSIWLEAEEMDEAPISSMTKKALKLLG